MKKKLIGVALLATVCLAGCSYAPEYHDDVVNEVLDKNDGTEKESATSVLNETAKKIDGKYDVYFESIEERNGLMYINARVDKTEVSKEYVDNLIQTGKASTQTMPNVTLVEKRSSGIVDVTDGTTVYSLCPSKDGKTYASSYQNGDMFVLESFETQLLVDAHAELALPSFNKEGYYENKVNLCKFLRNEYTSEDLKGIYYDSWHVENKKKCLQGEAQIHNGTVLSMAQLYLP